MARSLKEFIRQVRSCSTVADERAVVSKEAAAIRSGFLRDPTKRYVNVSKLIYIHTMGYPTQFGQIECLKLTGSGTIREKRLGYLGFVLLADRNPDMLTLLTNSLKVDMNSTNQAVASLALHTVGTIYSEALANELFSDIERHMTNSDPTLRKKAVFCAARLVKTSPNLCSKLRTRCFDQIDSKDHGVCLAGMTLAMELCRVDRGFRHECKNLVPSLVELLSHLVSGESAFEYNVFGISDPFLQIGILRLLRILGHRDRETSQKMHHVLSMAGSREVVKNAGHAILYEVVQTVLGIEADEGLREVAINIINRFLTSRDNNVKYVALDMLSTYGPNGILSKQHENHVLECLHDSDFSLRTRAQDLVFSLINESNLESILADLLVYMQTAHADVVPLLVPNMVASVEKYGNNLQWNIDMFIEILKMADHVDDKVIDSFSTMISDSGRQIQTCTVNKLASELEHDDLGQGFWLSIFWCIGEYGQYLDKSRNLAAMTRRLGELLIHPKMALVGKYHLVFCLAKLAARFSEMTSRVIRILDQVQTRDTELCQRIEECRRIVQDSNLRARVFGPMPMYKRPEKCGSAPRLDDSTLSMLYQLDLGESAVLKIGGTVQISRRLSKLDEYKVYSRNGLDVWMHHFTDSSDPFLIVFKLVFRNHRLDMIEGLRLGVAVPKHMQLYLGAPSSPNIPCNSSAVQIIRIAATEHSTLKIRFRIGYITYERSVEEEIELVFP